MAIYNSVTATPKKKDDPRPSREDMTKDIQNIIDDRMNKNEIIVGALNDGDHSFNDLYYHRMVLFSIICNMFKDKAWNNV